MHEVDKSYASHFGLDFPADRQQIGPGIQRAAIRIAEHVNEVVPGANVAIDNLLANRELMSRERWHVRRNLERFSSVYGQAVREQIINPLDPLPVIVGRHFMGEHLVASAILGWSIGSQRERDPTLHVNIVDLATWRVNQPDVPRYFFREVVYDFRERNDLIPVVLGNIAASGMKVSEYSKIPKAQLRMQLAE